jgi:hypothetical protein
LIYKPALTLDLNHLGINILDRFRIWKQSYILSFFTNHRSIAVQHYQFFTKNFNKNLTQKILIYNDKLTSPIFFFSKFLSNNLELSILPEQPKQSFILI